MYNKIFLIAFICLILATVVSAVERPLEIDYPEFGGFKPTTVQQTLLPDYIKYLFNFSLIIVGLIVFSALIIGGFLYLISSGNPSKLDAKDRIFGALIGLVLLLSSWLILNTINPQLTIFYPVGLEEVYIYQGQPGTVTLFAAANCLNLNNKPVCVNNEECTEEGTKCFDIFKDGTKRCVSETIILNLSKDPNLDKTEFTSDKTWADVASAFIFYGDNYEVRICENEDFKNCKIIREPNICHDIPSSASSVEVLTKVNGARLYTETNFGGKYQDFPFDENNICYTNFSHIGDNQASSIEVAPGYWTVACKESNGNCGWTSGAIIYNTFPEDTGYGDSDLGSGENYVGNNKLSKLCVMKFGSCGGVLVWDGKKSDFFPRGKQYQLGIDSLVSNNSIEEIYQYTGDCEIYIWENTGLGNQGKALGSHCHSDTECCGRQWESELSDWSNPDVNKFINFNDTTKIYNYDKWDIGPEYECPDTNGCCDYDEDGCINYCSACECDAYLYTFPDTFPEPFTWPDGKYSDQARCTCAGYFGSATNALFNPDCNPKNNCCGCESDLDNCCSRNDCNYDNAVHKKASCIQVLD